jgi:transposase
VRFPGADGPRQQIVQSFGASTPELMALHDWLMAHGVTQVAMESTGVCWKPVI